MDDHKAPRGSIVEVTYRDTTALYVVVQRIVGLLRTELALREWIPDALTVQSHTTRVDQRYCALVALPVRPGGKVQ